MASIAQTADMIQPGGMIFTGYEWGIDFFDVQGNVIITQTFTSEREFDVAFDNPQWPEGSKRLDSWKRPLYRQPVLGLDYGPGSVKRRFGGYVPRSTYRRGGW